MFEIKKTQILRWHEKSTASWQKKFPGHQKKFPWDLQNFRRVFGKLTTPYSRVPNTTVGNPYSFFGACPSYMALFGTSRLLNFVKSSFLHFYSELLAY